MLTVGEVLRRTSAYFADRGITTARLDAELLIAHAIGVERLALYTDHERPLDSAETARCRELVGRRAAREPVAYILGRRGFRRIELSVGPDVLVPRPETELLVEWVIEVAAEGAAVLDWGTGSGAIALALVDERPDLVVSAVERSEAALAVARANDADARVEWIHSDGEDALAGRSFDVVVSNPPYLSDAELAAAPPELAFEPAGALSAGPTGLEVLTRLADTCAALVRPGGWLIAEVGAGQAPSVADLWRGVGLGDVSVRDDLARIGRAVGGRRE